VVRSKPVSFQQAPEANSTSPATTTDTPTRANESIVTPMCQRRPYVTVQEH